MVAIQDLQATSLTVETILAQINGYVRFIENSRNKVVTAVSALQSCTANIPPTAD